MWSGDSAIRGPAAALCDEAGATPRPQAPHRNAVEYFNEAPCFNLSLSQSERSEMIFNTEYFMNAWGGDTHTHTDTHG